MIDISIKERLKAIRRRLNESKSTALVVTRPANVTYATGFSGDDSWALITKRGSYLITDSRYTEQARSQCVSCKIIERTNTLAKETANLLNKSKSASIVTVEQSTAVSDFQALKKSLQSRLKPAADIIETVRSCKDTNEISSIRKAARIAAQALKDTKKYIKPGITENELAGRLDFNIRKLGSKNSFETIVAFGPNASRPHHQPTTRKLKKNDTILIDFGARYNDYCSDLTRCFAVGKPSVFYKKVYEAVEKAQAAAIKMVKVGVEIKEVDSAAREVIKQFDLPVYGHGTGHGLGLEVHELPILSAKAKGRLKAGQIITIEPGVYIPGKLGVRIEDDVLVTKTGCRILSRF